MDNGIGLRQNLPENLKLLAAQRVFYSRAKKVAALQAWTVGLCPVFGAALTALKPEADVWAAIVGIGAALADTAWLDPKQAEFRKCGANAQEAFDTAVLQLSSNDALKGSCPTHEEIHEAAVQNVNSKTGSLVDWYPKKATELSLAQGRLICQRTNLWWDSELRRRYRGWVMACVGIMSVAAVCVGLAEQWSMRRFVLAIVAPLFPALMWAIRECRRQKDAAADLDRLRNYTEQLWGRVSKNTISEAELAQCSRSVQDAILVGRRERAVVFDWIYSRLRRQHEEQMNIGADAMAAELTNRPI
jgi:hypothetical protein